MWFALALLAGCQEPFGTDRHDLVGFRIAALTASVRPGEVRPRLAVVVEGRPWSDAPLDIRWHWVADRREVQDLDPADEPVARGANPRIRRRDAILAVLVGDGDTWRRAAIELEDREQVALAVSVERVPALELSTVTPEQLDLSARQQLETETSRSVDPGGFLRFTIDGPTSSSGLTRFMATDGTFFELDSKTADWAAGRIVVEDEEIVERAPADPGPVTGIFLWIDGPRSGFTSADVYVGAAPSGIWVRQRFLPAEQPLGGRIWASLDRDDASPTGLSLSAVAPALDSDSWDPAVLGCAGPVSGPFDPMWLLEMRCSRDAVEGQRVLLDGTL